MRIVHRPEGKSAAASARGCVRPRCRRMGSRYRSSEAGRSVPSGRGGSLTNICLARLPESLRRVARALRRGALVGQRLERADKNRLASHQGDESARGRRLAAKPQASPPSATVASMSSASAYVRVLRGVPGACRGWPVRKRVHLVRARLLGLAVLVRLAPGVHGAGVRLRRNAQPLRLCQLQRLRLLPLMETSVRRLARLEVLRVQLPLSPQHSQLRRLRVGRGGHLGQLATQGLDLQAFLGESGLAQG
eukprot:scaffold21887_cov72-Phaeocystis_antarctica.AAC.2